MSTQVLSPSGESIPMHQMMVFFSHPRCTALLLDAAVRRLCWEVETTSLPSPGGLDPSDWGPQVRRLAAALWDSSRWSFSADEVELVCSALAALRCVTVYGTSNTRSACQIALQSCDSELNVTLGGSSVLATFCIVEPALRRLRFAFSNEDRRLASAARYSLDELN